MQPRPIAPFAPFAPFAPASATAACRGGAARPLLLALLLAPALAAAAGPLADPTRPPGAATGSPAPAAAPITLRPLRPLSGRSGTGAAALPAAPPAANGDAPELSSAVLQAVQLPLRGPAQALVDGRLVKAGDEVDGQRVISIDSQGLLLRGAAGEQRLWLLPGTPKQAAGSLQTQQSARYVPAPRPAAETTPEPDAAAGNTRVGATPAPPAAPGPLSMAKGNPP